jgi:hypothetical protein
MFGIGQNAANPIGGVTSKLAMRTDLLARGGYEWLMDSCLELSRNFRFQWLERTGPLVWTEPGQSSYPLDQFLVPGEEGEVVNLIPSLFRYFLPFEPIPSTIGVNPGSQLLWKTVDALELMFNTPGIPAYFTRFGTTIRIAPVPWARFPMFLRYQVEHPFANPPSGQDPFLLDNDWREIAEYAAAERGAITLRMTDYATNYHQILFGDPEFERSSGGRGNPGLIFRRISQIEGDSESQMRQIRPMVPLL